MPEIAKIAHMNSLPFSTCKGQAWEMSRHYEFADWLHLLHIKFGLGSENTGGRGGKPKTYCLCLLAAGLVLQGAECLNPRWGGGDTMVLTYLCTSAQNSLLLVFIKPQKPASPLKLSPHLSLCLCHWLECPWLLWCRKHISTWVILCIHKCGTGVVKGCACLNLKTTGAAGHSCALSADSDKEGVMFLILECEKALYQQGHERENCTAASQHSSLRWLMSTDHQLHGRNWGWHASKALCLCKDGGSTKLLWWERWAGSPGQGRQRHPCPLDAQHSSTARLPTSPQPRLYPWKHKTNKSLFTFISTLLSGSKG